MATRVFYPGFFLKLAFFKGDDLRLGWSGHCFCCLILYLYYTDVPILLQGEAKGH